ncbi:MAG TPA: class I SAM-dependent methyltransferase [Solirubrobacteraceae bacterium]|jgi:2-polyprenyl-3-methyl-5-hydroxy-6-metoxy-1,4-benzoquinol methylase|nr:class I SAM-dependent methyltransferase [Solirubrobacteraceae bacterium]
MGVQERLTLQAIGQPTLIAGEHVHRYELAAALCHGARVVDLCCGAGYGGEILATRATSVHGVDYDAATIDLAANALGDNPKLTFEAADAAAFLRRELAGSFDVIVCFEGLEHLPDPEGALRELRRHAAAGIAVICSVPNSRGMGEENEFHVTDFGYAEASAAFAGFPDAVIVRQYLAEGSVIMLDGAAELDARLYGVERAEPEYANHFILVSGVPDETLAGVHRGRMQLAMAPNYNRYMHDLERANVQLRRRNHELARGLLGKAGSAAPSYVQKAERQIAGLEAVLVDQQRLQHELELERRNGRRQAEELMDAQLQLKLVTARTRGGVLARLAARLR